MNTPPPVGPLAVLAEDLTENPVVIAAGFCSATELWERLPTDRQTEMRMTDQLGSLDGPIAAYLGGDLAAIDRIPLDQAGTELQQEVWKELQAIPAGETRTYSEVAGATSSPKAVRAVGTACGRNLIAPFVPCHRALRSDGSLGGYLFGLEVKRWLLSHESQDQTAAERRSLSTPAP